MVVGTVAAAVIGTLGVVPALATFKGQSEPADKSLRSLGMRHGLYVGTAINDELLANPDETRYQEIAATEFSTVTAENAMKWESLEPTRGTYDWTKADALVDFARKNNQKVRGHVLVWNNQLPTWLTEGVADGSITKDELRDLLKNHITNVVTHFKGKIWQWDVVNEAVTDSWATADGVITYKGFWAENLGPEYIADAFRWARAADSKALLFYNDYNIEAFGDEGPGDKTYFVYNMVKELRAQGVPVDGIGSQGHLGTQYGNYDTFQAAAALDRFAELGVATAFTEVDVRSKMTEAVKAGDSEEINPRLQASAENFSVLMEACLASRHCLSYTVWGIGDHNSWVNYTDLGAGKGSEGLALIHDENYQPKKAYQAIKADLAFSGGPYVSQRAPQKPMKAK
jgi:endo-1,4-beta-xylanase